MIYSDIYMVSDDLAIDEYQQAVIIEDRDVIIQDLIHAIRESGFLVDMIAERNADKRRLLMNKIILLAEDDERIIPGTVELSGDPGSMTLTGDTYDFGTVKMILNQGVES